MLYKYPHVALNVMAELALKKGDCAAAILAAATSLGFAVKEQVEREDFTCDSESALAKIVDQATFDMIKAEIAKREADGSLLPCQASPEQMVSSCFSKCPLLFDLCLQADNSKA